MAAIVFWLALGTMLYVYVGYPLMLMAWRRLAPRPVRKADCEPTVSLVIAMHNEIHDAEAKMQNCFQLDYPLEKLQIIVSLDAPTDGTDDILRQYRGRRVEVVVSQVRCGKASALNSGVALATGEIVVFADARQRFDRRAIRELVANFADSSVGAVSGQLILLDREGREAGDAAGLYWRYEKALRAMESEIHSVPGATGAIYAIRREMYSPLRPKTVLDDVVNPMRIVLAGKRAILESNARAYDASSVSPEVEFGRKRRTLMGNYELFIETPQLLLPWRNPIFIQMVSHKVGRLVVPYCLVAMLISNCFLLRGLYSLFFAGQMAWYFLACIGWLVSTNGVSAQQRPQAARIR
jgi:cellulose synthase/poly-beta-1,6-N-acetylglucosamine synthase-like glycosyltransferase